MKKRWIVLALAGGYAAFLLATAPAWLLADNLGRVSQGMAEARQPQGTLWNGSARIVLPRQRLELQRVAWQFQPLGLLQGEWRYAVSVDDAALQAKAVIGRGFTRFIVRDATAALPATTAAAVVPELGVFSPSGTIELAIANIRCTTQACEGDVAAQWRNAGVSLAEQRPLGDYALTAVLKPEQGDFEIKTLAGVLRFAGRGTWQPPQHISFNGEASAAPDVLPRVRGLLATLGTPDERGTVKINVAGR